MKKLLSLLSVLTISGTAVPTTIAASPYQQKENNLENLIIRNKRQNNKQNIIGILEVIITTNVSAGFSSSGVVLNNKVYFGSYDFKVYEYDHATNKQIVVITTNVMIESSGVVLNNKLYIGSWDRNVYEYDPLELIESETINMQEQIKRGLYLYYKKQNTSYELKKIYNINLENLTLSDFTIEQTQKNKSSNLEQDINDFCKDSNSTFINNSSIEQTQNTVSCYKHLTETNTLQKMNGFSKSESTANNNNWSWNWNTKVTVKAGGSAGIPLIAEGKVETSVETGFGHTWGGSKTYTIGEEVTNSANTEIKITTETIIITVPSQPVKIPPHSKISISVNAWTNNIALILSYYKKVQGMVSADFLDKNNNRTTVSISIKDAMSSLLENNILPSKIIINNDNRIKFSYDIKSQKEIIMHQTEIEESIPLISYEENVLFKDNITSVVVQKS